MWTKWISKQMEEASEEAVRPLLFSARNSMNASPEQITWEHVATRRSTQLQCGVNCEEDEETRRKASTACFFFFPFFFLLKCCSICFGQKAAFVLPGVYGLIKWSVILMVFTHFIFIICSVLILNANCYACSNTLAVAKKCAGWDKYMCVVCVCWKPG